MSRVANGWMAAVSADARAVIHHDAPLPEPMIDAKQAAVALQFPSYWFADQTMRKRYRIPHYLLGGLVRYRMSELLAWAMQSTAAAQRDVADADDQPPQGAV